MTSHSCLPPSCTRRCTACLVIQDCIQFGGHLQDAVGLLRHRRCSADVSDQGVIIHITAVGGRIKYLVDTPETLWGCLDSGSFLAAAHRFLRASLVYEALQGGDAASAMRQFPLVRTQWPLVAKFRSESSTHAITHNVAARLNAGSACTAAHCTYSCKQAEGASTHHEDSSGFRLSLKVARWC
jgi:hypothetical protein